MPTTFLAIVNTSLLHLPEALFKQSSICDILRVTYRGPLFVKMSNRVILIQKSYKFPILHVPKYDGPTDKWLTDGRTDGVLKSVRQWEQLGN